VSDKNWNGQGFPKVGQFIRNNINGGKPVEVVSTGVNQVCTITNSGFLSVYCIIDCLPVLNPKQVARDKVIAEMVKTAYTTENGTITEKLYDAGFRKFKPLPNNVYDLWVDECMPLLDEWLIENGYCIGEDE